MTIVPFPQRPEMNLERVEELCLNYLRQAENPLVGMEALLAHCRRDPKCAKLGMEDLVPFLRAHVQVELMDAVPVEDPAELEVMRAAGFEPGPRAVLKSRIPTSRELSRLMLGQLEEMERQLNSALAVMEETKDDTLREQQTRLREAVDRVTLLRDKMREYL